MYRLVAACWLVLAGLLAAPVAWAADAAMFERVQQRLFLAAGPWCDRIAELGTDGQRHCRLRVDVIDDKAVVATAVQTLGAVAVTRSMLVGLDEAELAVVVGHEIAHLVLGHGRRRLALAAATAPPSERRMFGLMDDWLKGSTPEGHPDTPGELREQEFDADALGLLWAMRAGYPATTGERLFRRAVGALPGWEASARASHPAPTERAEALQRRAERWCALVAAGEPLLPAEARLLPLADYRRDEARHAPSAHPPAAVCEPAAVAAAETPSRSLAATPFARPFMIGGHRPDGPCAHCEPR